jgi:peptidyl-prolyl cis-trans isomerase C
MGTTLEEFTNEIRTQLQVEKLVEQAVGDVADVTEEEEQAFYEKNTQYFETPEQVSARHILLSFEEGMTDEEKAAKKAELEAIRAQIVEGADFAELAKEHSACPSSERGGDLGSFGKGNMVPEFEQAAFSLEPGGLSGIVETTFGYHLIQVTDKQEAGKTPFADVKDQIGEHLKQQKQEQAWEAYMGGLRDEAEIKFAE